MTKRATAVTSIAMTVLAAIMTNYGSSSAQQKEGSKSNKKQTKKTKKTKKKNRKDSKKSGGRNKTPTSTRKKGSILDEQLEGLLSLKLEEMKYKKRKHEREERKHEREEEQNKRRKLEDYDLTDAEQWMEFAARFEAIKETVGGDPVRAALQFPRFAETTLLTADEKKEFHNQQVV
eukprot:scaffold12225_cov122-Skeletonema_marinoi.AAC.1